MPLFDSLLAIAIAGATFTIQPAPANPADILAHIGKDGTNYPCVGPFYANKATLATLCQADDGYILYVAQESLP